MDVHEGKQKFIESWGKMASDWGINRTMAQVHALLLIAPEPLTADQVMEELTHGTLLDHRTLAGRLPPTG